MQEIKKFAAKVKVTKQNKGSKILLSLDEAAGVEAEIIALQKKVKELEDKISNYVPEIIYIERPPMLDISEPKEQPTVVKTEPTKKKIQVVNVSGSPFRD